MHAELRALLGEDAKLFAIIARDGFALRYGPMTFEQADELVMIGKRNCFPVMITVDCGPAAPDGFTAPTRQTIATIASLFGATQEERRERMERQSEPLRHVITALLIAADNVAHLLMMRGGKEDPARLLLLREAFKPVDALSDRLRAEAIGDDEGCPFDDPDCDGPADGSHEACERPKRTLTQILGVAHAPHCAAVATLDGDRACNCGALSDHTHDSDEIPRVPGAR